MLRRVERAYRCISRCNRLVISALPEAALLQRMCKLAVDDAGYRLAWVGYAVADAARTVRPVAQYGYEAGYLDSIRIDWADDAYGAGPTGTAIRTGKAALARNILDDPSYDKWRAQALARGYAASVALPLVDDTRCFGAFNLYAAEPDAFDEAELELLTEMAMDLTHGIRHARGQVRLSALEATVARNEVLDAAGRVAAGIAHDVRNLLHVIGLASEELDARVGRDPVCADDLAQIREALARASALNQDLMRLQQPSAEPVEPVPADPCLQSLWELLAPSVRVEARVTFDAAAAQVAIRRSDLERVLSNLVLNARDAMADGGVLTIATSVRQLDYPMAEPLGNLAPGLYYSLVVEDSGVGMSEEVQRRLYEPFFTTKGAGGTGLGLATCFGIVRHAGGAIVVRSSPGQGSRFEVLLPAQV